VNTDMSIIKRIRLDGLKRGLSVDVRAEAFNLFNHVNLGPPTNDMSSAAFGRIGNTATDAREFQVGVKVTF
jgi:hypothetical protein